MYNFPWCLFTIIPCPTLLSQVCLKVDMTRAHGASFLFELVKCGAVGPDEKVLQQPGASRDCSQVEHPAKVLGEVAVGHALDTPVRVVALDPCRVLW